MIMSSSDLEVKTISPPRAEAAAGPGSTSPGRQLWLRGLRRRSLWVAAALWVAANCWVALAGGDTLPFDWPARTGRSVAGHLLDVNLALVQILLLMSVVYLITRRRTPPDVAARAPDRALALRETLLLVGYGVLGLVGGYVVAKAFGWHPFGLHLAGTIYGTHTHLEPAEVLTWAGYNLLVYAVLPLIYFRRRYSPQALSLRSSNRKNDLLVIVVVLTLEAAFQIFAVEPGIFTLPPGQLLPGAAVTFVLYLAGAVMPAMVFVYAILVPRYLRLTRSATTTVLLGGLSYAGLHIWDAWAVFTSPRGAVLSLIFLLFTYLGPGMIKTFLTLRTGNAWVHVWAYHAFAPHTLIDTPHIVDIFRIR
jgi:hypothetical protein